MKTLLILAILLPTVALGQEAPPADSLDPLGSVRFLLGTWKGFGKGIPGNSNVDRSYEFVLDSSFVMGTNRSVYQAQDRNPRGESHENWDFFSYDRERDVLVLRQFHNEAIVNTFVLDSTAEGGRTLFFTSEHVENFTPGWRARLTYRNLGGDAFRETFELAGPGEEFRVFVENSFLRKK